MVKGKNMSELGLLKWSEMFSEKRVIYKILAFDHCKIHIQ